MNISSAVPESPSRIETSPTESAGNVAAASSLVTVPVAEPSAMVAPSALARRMVKVSLLSATLSLLTFTSMVFDVSPAAKVRVPLAAT